MMDEIVIATGDPQGVGPEVSVRAARAFVGRERRCACVLAGDPAVLARAGAGADVPRVGAGAAPAGLSVLEVPAPLDLADPPPSEAGGRAALDALDAAADRVFADPGRALVTAPISKQAARLSSPDFDGHTGYLARRAGVRDPVMMFVTPAFRVALLTVHQPLAAVPGLVSEARLRRVVEVLRADLRTRFGVPDARIHVLGLNPHAGEGGGIGREEEEIVKPAIARLAAEGVRILGPFPADSYFRPGFETESDAIVALYHDQGLLPVKCLAFGTAVNVTLGLPIVRTSVDHGTAFDRAWRGEVAPGSMECAIATAREILARVRSRAG